MKLYYSPGACSTASHIALLEAGLKFEIDQVDFGTLTTASGEDFSTVNPKAYVPALRLDDGSVLTESAAILQYIADQAPSSGLAPGAGSQQRYRLQEWLNFIATEIHKSYSQFFNESAAMEVKAYARDSLSKRLQYVEAALADRQYLMGGGFTVADALLFIVVSWSKTVGFDLAPYPNIKRYLKNIRTRPSVQAALMAEGLVPQP